MSSSSSLQDTFPRAKATAPPGPEKEQASATGDLIKEKQRKEHPSMLAEAGPACESRGPEYPGHSWLRGRPGGRGPSI